MTHRLQQKKQNRQMTDICQHSFTSSTIDSTCCGMFQSHVVMVCKVFLRKSFFSLCIAFLHTGHAMIMDNKVLRISNCFTVQLKPTIEHIYKNCNSQIKTHLNPTLYPFKFTSHAQDNKTLKQQTHKILVDQLFSNSHRIKQGYCKVVYVCFLL